MATASARRPVLAIAAGLVLVGLSLGSAQRAEAATATQNFTAQGCSVWTVPGGVASVQIHATAAAGGSSSASGGNGDEVSADLSGLSGGQSLDVCVNQGGGGGSATGGGASGVSKGLTFSTPVLVAGGGGSGGRTVGGGFAGAGGSAGLPSGSGGGYGGGTSGGGGGGNDTTATGGAGGCGCVSTAGASGSGFSAGGPGMGGHGGGFAGGGGGGGYYAGGGGGQGYYAGYYDGGGGGGGSDFCTNTATVTGCAVTSGAGTQNAAGSAPGDAQVVLSYAVPQPPTITSGASTTLTVGIAGSFTITTTGISTPSVSDGAATLPSGVTFTDNGDGTATLSGTPAVGTAGTFPVTMTASNGATPDAMQNFTLTVQRRAVTVSLTATPTSVIQGGTVTIVATVTPASGTGTPTGTVSFSDAPIAGCQNLALVGGTATCTTTTLAVGSDPITATYSGDGTFASSSVSPTVTVSTNAVIPPAAVVPAPRAATITVPSTGANAEGGHEPVWPLGVLLLVSGGTLLVRTMRARSKDGD